MVLYLVIPCYNEEAVLPITAAAVREKMEALIAAGTIGADSRVLFVDDGSKDGTWAGLEQLTGETPLFAALKLAHNVGHQNALLAGLMEAKEHCDAAVSMDADLQDDINAIDGFLAKYAEGCDVVYGVRNKRDTDTRFKRSTALAFYRLMGAMGVESVYNHADYRLMSRRALEALSEYREVNLFLRGIVPLIGYRSDYVYYDRRERAAGESKYPLKKMLNFAAEGITSFSVKPLRIISAFGILIACLSVFGLLYSLISKLTGSAVSGWTAIVASIWLLGGIQLLCIGVCGEYIGKIYSEVKARPRYHEERLILAEKAPSGENAADGEGRNETNT
mgnify:CR=1 FL=1